MLIAACALGGRNPIRKVRTTTSLNGGTGPYSPGDCGTGHDGGSGLPPCGPHFLSAAGVDVPVRDVLKSIGGVQDRKSTRLNSSHQIISYAVFCLKKKKNDTNK